MRVVAIPKSLISIARYSTVKYVTGDIDARYLKRLEDRRNDTAKRKKSEK